MDVGKTRSAARDGPRAFRSIVCRAAFKAAKKPERSIFICGCGHSGTTLLTRILGAHSAIYAFPRETWAFTAATPHWHIILRMTLEAVLSGRPVLVEKTPKHVHSVDTIRSIFKTPTFVLAARDGRDVVSSLAKRYGSEQAAFDRWLFDTSALADQIGKPDTVLWRYEDLIENPHQNLEALTSALGLHFEAGMLNYHNDPRRWGKRTKSAHLALRDKQVHTPLYDSRGKWKDHLSAPTLERFDHGRPRELMALLGY